MKGIIFVVFLVGLLSLGCFATELPLVEACEPIAVHIFNPHQEIEVWNDDVMESAIRFYVGIAWNGYIVTSITPDGYEGLALWEHARTLP